RPVRAIEREHARRYLGVRDAAFDAGEALAEVDLARILAVEALDLEQVVAIFEGHFEGIAQALFDAGADRQSIDDYLDRVALIFVERDVVAQFPHRAIDFDPHEAGPAHVAQFLAVLALAIAHDGREHVKPRVLRPGHDTVHDLLHALLRDFAAAVVA